MVVNASNSVIQIVTSNSATLNQIYLPLKGLYYYICTYVVSKKGNDRLYTTAGYNPPLYKKYKTSDRAVHYLCRYRYSSGVV